MLRCDAAALAPQLQETMVWELQKKVAWILFLHNNMTITFFLFTPTKHISESEIHDKDSLL